MDDILLFTLSTRSHIAKLEHLVKALLKKRLKNISKEMPII